MAYVQAHNLDLSKPEDRQRIKEHFKQEFIDLTPLEPVPILQETPKLATTENIKKIKEKQGNGKKRPELGEYE